MSCENVDFEQSDSTSSDIERIRAIANHYSEIIRLVGEDPMREGLLKTPMRAAKALWFATQGYRSNPSEILKQAIFSHCGSQMVVVRDIEFYSFCEHHILPFFGSVSVGYIPDGQIVGLSKLPRIVNAYARRFQVQERLTAEICECVQRELHCKGVIVVASARHLCMQMRGVEKQMSSTETIHYTGLYEKDAALRAEFFSMIRQ